MYMYGDEMNVLIVTYGTDLRFSSIYSKYGNSDFVWLMDESVVFFFFQQYFSFINDTAFKPFGFLQSDPESWIHWVNFFLDVKSSQLRVVYVVYWCY